MARGDPEDAGTRPALTDAQSHHHAAPQQRLLVAGGRQHAGPGREEAAGQQDAGPAAAQPVEDAAGQSGQRSGAHRAGDQQLLPQRVQVQLPLEEQQGPRHHAGVVAEEEAPEGGEYGHHVDEAGRLVPLELPPRRPLQLRARRRAVQAGARLGGDQAALARRRRARAGGPLRLPPPLLAHQVAQAPQRVLHIVAGLAGHGTAAAGPAPPGGGRLPGCGAAPDAAAAGARPARPSRAALSRAA